MNANKKMIAVRLLSLFFLCLCFMVAHHDFSTPPSTAVWTTQGGEHLEGISQRASGTTVLAPEDADTEDRADSDAGRLLSDGESTVSILASTARRNPTKVRTS